MPATCRVVLFASALLCLAAGSASQSRGPAKKAPGVDSAGKVYEWQSKDGLSYQYYLPKSYKDGEPLTLTFILHGSNLDRRWGFANHKAGTFRADDLVVCPDGTTSNGNGGFNFLQGKKDLERLHTLQEELAAAFTVRATLLYGHSQGSFFSFLYAGAYPESVQGVVGQASGVWIGTRMTKKHHHQAIVLMHGTDDPVVPYGQSVGGLDAYREAKYPMARLRSLDGWNHWPTQLQTEQQLAWCEAMTTEDPGRIAASLAAIDGQKAAVDPVALYQVAQRAAAMEGVDKAVAKQASAAMAAIQAAAKKHAQAIRKSSGKNKKLTSKPWVGHLPLFARHFAGVPECDTVLASWKKVFDAHEKVSDKQAKTFWKNRDQKPAKAFPAGVKVVADAFLSRSSENKRLLASLEEWAKAGKKAGISKASLKAYKSAVPVLQDARKKGRKAFDKVSKRFR